MLQTFAYYLIAGGIAGLLAGLFGIGGGTILVPILAWSFLQLDLPPHLHMHIAVGTSLGVILLNASSSVRAHHRHGSVDWRVAREMTIGVVLGAWLGAWVAHALSSRTLASIFSVFLVFVALQLLLGKAPRPDRGLPGRLGLATAGLLIGVISALVGIGGGSLTVPFLTWCNMGVIQAVATSAAVGLGIATAGSLGYVVTGLQEASLPPWSLGYLYLPALGGLALAGMVTAPLGARWAHVLPAARLKQAFGVFLLLVAVRMLTAHV